MKHRWWILLVALLLCASTLKAEVRVLSVCVADYPERSGWNHLGAANDSKSINSLFPNVVSLRDSKATYKAFASELKKLSLSASEGDTVIIHFSGHGQQILTPASSSEADRVDEAMVPFDAAKRKTAIYHGQNHFTDDSFGEYVGAIREKVGPTGLVIAVIDACHSGSMDKDAGGRPAADHSGDVYRGTDEILGAESLPQDSITALRNFYFANDCTAVTASELMADAIFIGACETHQRNYEIKRDGESYGSLTYYFCRAYKEKGLSDINDFLITLHSEMSEDNTLKFHGQHPSIRTSFAWESPAPEKFIPQDQTVNSPQATNNLGIWLAAGLSAFVAALLSIIIIKLWKKRTK